MVYFFDHSYIRTGICSTIAMGIEFIMVHLNLLKSKEWILLQTRITDQNKISKVVYSMNDLLL